MFCKCKYQRQEESIRDDFQLHHLPFKHSANRLYLRSARSQQKLRYQGESGQQRSEGQTFSVILTHQQVPTPQSEDSLDCSVDSTRV